MCKFPESCKKRLHKFTLSEQVTLVEPLATKTLQVLDKTKSMLEFKCLSQKPPEILRYANSWPQPRPSEYETLGVGYLPDKSEAC